MRVLLINPPYQTITSTFGVGHQVPLGLLTVGGPLLRAGHEVRLLDGEALRLDPRRIGDAVERYSPGVVMTGHAGSTPAHPACMATLAEIRRRRPAPPIPPRRDPLRAHGDRDDRPGRARRRREALDAA